MKSEKPSRRCFLTQTSLACTLSMFAPRIAFADHHAKMKDDAMTDEALPFLRDITAAVVEASRVRPGESVMNMPANTTGGTLIRPGGRTNYPSFWVRDFAMSLDCDLVTIEEIHHGVRVIASRQNGDTQRRLQSGAIIPPYAIADHINFDGQPVFYPGTYSPGEDQGGGIWGVLPPIDDHYYFIHAAYRLYKAKPDIATMQEDIIRYLIHDDHPTVNTHFAGLQVALIPEPASLALMGIGGLLMLRRRRA